MGNAQSRQRRDAQWRRRHHTSTSPPSTQSSHRSDASDHDQDPSIGTHGGPSRKRSRESSHADPSEGVNADEPQLRQRRRLSHIARHSSSPHPPPEATDNAMHIDAQEAAQPTPSTFSPPIAEPIPAVPVPDTAATQNPSQQRNGTTQPSPGSPAIQGHGATPPPHLDVLREERERARRQILQALASAPSAPPGDPPPNGLAAAATQASIPAHIAPSQPAAATSPSPMASAAMAALLGAMAANRAASNPSQAPSAAVAPSLPASAPTAATSSAVSSTEPQQQAPQQPSRPHAIRVPLQPEMISGTSMVVQGALVARTIPNPSSSEAGDSTISPSSTQASEQRPNQTEWQSNATATASDPARPAQADTRPRLPGAEDDHQRGAVTLEEQAVMLSRILSIAAAATAASLLNTSESHHVDPSLLQTSLRRPFERLNQQQNTDRTQPWLADWQTSSGNNGRASADSNGGASRLSNNTAASSNLGDGLRGRLAALSRRFQSASSSSGLPSAEQPERSNHAASDTQAARHPSQGGAAADDPNARVTAADRQEIVDALLRAAEHQRDNLESVRRGPLGAEPETTVRDRVVSASSIQPESASAQQSVARSGLSRLVRSTLDNFMRPTRLLSARDSRSEAEQPQESAFLRDGWSQGTTASASSSIPSNAATSGFSLGPNDVAGTLRQVRNGILPDGVPGSFGSFLNLLVRDLMAAVQLMRPSSEAPAERREASSTNYFENAVPAETTSGAEVLDGDAAESTVEPSTTPASAPLQEEQQQQQSSSASDADGEDLETQARRNRDFQSGNLSFFRLFRFDPVAPSHLVPCIVVGVRSLEVTERFGEEMVGVRPAGSGREFGVARQQTSRPTTLGSARPTAMFARQRSQSEGPPTVTPTAATEAGPGQASAAGGEELPASRFMLFVSGGRYPPNHPLLTSNPATAGRDLMILMDLLSTMQAMQNKPSTVTQQEIDASELRKIKGSQVADMVEAGLITENMAERCLVCLEDWKEDDEVRMLACKHGFHVTCVDRWMTNSSNTCPMCRRQGVSKDGRRAGEETADSQGTAQAQP